MLLENNDLIRFEGYVIDRSDWTLCWEQEPIALNRKSFDLLVCLIDRRDRVSSKDELLDSLWPDQFVEESNLTQQIFLLRKALSRHESGRKIIETVPGRGYRFTARVEIVPRPNSEAQGPQQIVLNATKSLTEITIEEESGVEPRSRAEARPASTDRRSLWIVGGVLAAAVLAVLGWFSWQRWLDRTAGQPIDVILTPMDGSTGDAILDAALVDALRMDLAQSPFVSIVSPARVRATLEEMKHKPDDAMTPAMSREVCERTNGQAVLHGSVARIGQHFLITEAATSCVNGGVLAEAKREASNLEDLPHSIDKLAESLRQKLGESRRSIARFDTPLFPGNTASLEALKDFSQSQVLSNDGKFVDAIFLLRKAIAADPDFPDAYYNLAAFYRATQDFAGEREAIVKAYSLRDSASEPIRLAIIALYHAAATQDLYEAERNYRNWTELYPRSAQAWNGLSVVERDLGHHSQALIAAQRALELRPTVVGVYANVATEQMLLGDPKGALATSQAALAKGLDGDYIRQHLFQAAYALHNAELVQKQRDWAAAHPDASYIRIDELEIAITEGRFSDAHRMIPPLNVSFSHRGLADAANFIVRAEAMNLIETGDVAAGTQLFRTAPVDPKDELSVLGLARVGDSALSEKYLRAMQAEFPQGTLWNDYRAPEVEAAIAMTAHKPKDAISALERARPLEGREPVIPMLRGNAYLAAGEAAFAEKSYRQVVEGPNQSPDTEELPVCWLGLGRALAAQGKRSAAVEAYKHFLTLWAHADADALYLRQAKQELAALETKADSK